MWYKTIIRIFDLRNLTDLFLNTDGHIIELMAEFFSNSGRCVYSDSWKVRSPKYTFITLGSRGCICYRNEKFTPSTNNSASAIGDKNYREYVFVQGIKLEKLNY